MNIVARRDLRKITTQLIAQGGQQRSRARCVRRAIRIEYMESIAYRGDALRLHIEIDGRHETAWLQLRAGVFHPTALHLVVRGADIDAALLVGQRGRLDGQIRCLDDAGIGNAVAEIECYVAAADHAACGVAGVVGRQVDLRHQGVDRAADRTGKRARRVGHGLLGVPQHGLVERTDLLWRQGGAKLDIVRFGEVDGVVVEDRLLLVVYAEVVGRTPGHAVDEGAGAGLRHRRLTDQVVFCGGVVVEQIGVWQQIGRSYKSILDKKSA